MDKTFTRPDIQLKFERELQAYISNCFTLFSSFQRRLINSLKGRLIACMFVIYCGCSVGEGKFLMPLPPTARFMKVLLKPDPFVSCLRQSERYILMFHFCLEQKEMPNHLEFKIGLMSHWPKTFVFNLQFT